MTPPPSALQQLRPLLCACGQVTPRHPAGACEGGREGGGREGGREEGGREGGEGGKKEM